MINNIVLQGRITKDLELKTTTSGKSCLKFSIANEVGFGEKKTTNFINVACWEKLAERVSQYCHKGSMVIVRGEIRVANYEVNGEKRTAYEVTAQEVVFLDSKPTTNSNPTNIAFEEDDTLPF